jgi:hypothetical protein
VCVCDDDNDEVCMRVCVFMCVSGCVCLYVRVSGCVCLGVWMCVFVYPHTTEELTTFIKRRKRGEERRGGGGRKPFDQFQGFGGRTPVGKFQKEEDGNCLTLAVCPVRGVFCLRCVLLAVCSVYSVFDLHCVLFAVSIICKYGACLYLVENARNTFIAPGTLCDSSWKLMI